MIEPVTVPSPPPSTQPFCEGPPADPFADLDRLGNEIARLSAHIQAATYRLLVLIREFDERSGWNTGFRSCAHWLNWRTGLDMGAAREKVRVARALVDLPTISAAMERGQLSYSKVRALTRVATPETEEELLEFGLAGTAAHVERLVRSWRRVDRIEAMEEGDLQLQQRYLRYFVDEDGMMVVKARLTPEVGALFRKALEAATEALYQKSRESSDSEGSGIPAEQRRADALELLLESALEAGLDSGTAGDRYQVVVHGRVAPGGCPPEAPTDPDVRDSRIRLLGLRFRCAVVDSVDDAWGRQGIVPQQTIVMLPSHLGRVRASV